MNRDDIIRMAREAGYGLSLSDVHAPALERFAAIVAAAERDRIADEAKHILKRAEARGAAAEREACAKICEELHASNYGVNGIGCAVIIRARGEK